MTPATAAFAPILDRALFGAANAPRVVNESLRAAISDKNFHWYHRYRSSTRSTSTAAAPG
jgi:hypothetical protein